MSARFLDTTVLVGLSDLAEPTRTTHQNYVDSHQPSTIAFYACRELLAGPVQYICDAHNRLLGSQNHIEAMASLSRLPAVSGRKKQVPYQVVFDSLREIFGVGKAGTPDDFKREGLQAIMMKAVQLWRRGNAPKSVVRVQDLGCFNGGNISIGKGGELRGPNDTFNCLKPERCSAAGYLAEDQIALDKLIDALHPSQLDDVAKDKNENAQRRKALKEVKSKGPKLFDKRRCRAIGDAYFVVMCPPGSTVATTNLRDFEPLCSALGKKVEKP
jgi:hypothetical protein